MGRLSNSLREAWRLRGIRSSLANKRSGETPASKADLLFLRARTMLRAGDWEMASRLFSDAAVADPTFAEALEARGELLDLKGQTEGAAMAYAAARKARALLRPRAPDRHFALRQRGQFVAEIMAYNAVLRSLKKNALPYLARGNAFLASGRPEKALADYDRALKLKPKLLDVGALRGEALLMLGQYRRALQTFDGALVVRANDFEALGGRAITRLALGQIGEANVDWRRQFDLLVGRAAARTCIALRLADYAVALSEVEAALIKEPADPYWQLYQMTARRRLGNAVVADEVPQTNVWPGPLLALHMGRISEDEVLMHADTADRRAEALFQLGVLAFARDSASAERYWREVVDRSAPSLIEHAAARNELVRLGS